MDKEKRAAKKQREDQALNRVLWWFGGAVLLEFFLLLLNRFYIHYDASGILLAYRLAQALRILAWVSAAAAVAGVVWLILRLRQRKTLFPAGVCVAAAAAMLVCTLVSIWWEDVGVQFLYVSVPVIAVLALVYYLYQRDFFLVALQGGVALFSLWGYRKLAAYHMRAVYVLFLVSAVITLALAVFAYLLQTKGGKLGARRVLPKDANYLMLYAASGVTALSLIVALALGVSAAFAALFAVIAWLFGAAVYYTVRLI